METILVRGGYMIGRRMQHAGVMNVCRRLASSYQASVNNQPPLNKPFTGEKFDLNAVDSRGYGPVHPKVKQLQEFYQTDNGKEIWRKTPFDEFMYRFVVAGTIGLFFYSMWCIWWLINPKPVKKD